MKILQYGIVLLFIVTLWGCGKGNSNAPVTIDPVTQKHSAGWAANGTGGTHPDAYFANNASCQECHGKLGTDAFATGGISGVSCSNPGRSGVACHPSFPHVDGFAAVGKHGSVARDVASGLTGMAHCKQCHGSSYTGSGTAPSCIGCHQGLTPSSNAPHAPNWITGTNGDGIKHGNRVDITNAPACAQCHLGGTNTPTSHKEHTPPAGLAPDCFNNTLCHGPAGHALPYVTGHQADAKANLSSCLPSCHATAAPASVNPRYNQQKGTGVLSAAGCEGCHNRPGIAHPFMWLPGRGGSTTSSHTTAGSVNGSCGLCHGGTALTGGSVAYPGGIVPPSCFPASSINGTSCHFTKPVDAQGVSVGCVSCHGAPPTSAIAAAAPNRAYRHTGHFTNIAGITCSECHNGFGSGTTTHATKAVFAAITASVALNPKYNENGLAATYSSTTQKCSNVSCHGGKIIPIPTWKGVTVFNQNLCAFNCHTISAVTPATYAGPYIGPFSGSSVNFPNLHNAHAAILSNSAGLCANCHSTPGASHYANSLLGKRVLVPGFASGTITGIGIVPGGYTYSSANTPTSSCLTIAGCHPAARAWF